MKTQEHIDSHIRSLEMSKLYQSVAMVIGIGLFHFASFFFHREPWLITLTAQIYFIPVLFAGITSGFLLALIISVGAICIHLVIMFWFLPQGQLLSIEYLMGMPMLLVVGIVTGLLQDHYRFADKKANKARELFGKYVSPEILLHLDEKEIQFAGEEKSATVVFTDLVGFTNLTEDTEPEILFRLLNDYFSEMVPIIQTAGGFVNKFIGDSIMAVFGLPAELEHHESIALKTAIELHHRLHQLNHRPAFREKNLTMAIGVNSGKLIAGNLGGPNRMEYTVIGDNVNLASRVESLNRKYNSHLLITDQTYKAIRKDDYFLTREVDAVRVKGRRRPVVLYEVYNCCEPEDLHFKTETLADFSAALQFYKSAEWDEAERKFRRVQRVYSDDTISLMYLERIRYLRNQDVKEWDGVFNYDQKK